jgi:hypothetical protein
VIRFLQLSAIASCNFCTISGFRWLGRQERTTNAGWNYECKKRHCADRHRQQQEMRCESHHRPRPERSNQDCTAAGMQTAWLTSERDGSVSSPRTAYFQRTPKTPQRCFQFVRLSVSGRTPGMMEFMQANITLLACVPPNTEA